METSFWLFMLTAGSLMGGTVYAGHEGDPHYIPAGFFDTHVCNWPENPRFLMAVFSTPSWDEVAKVAVFAPDGTFISDLDLTRFRAFKTQSGQTKRAFIAHFDLPEKAVDGWYRAEVSLRDGSRFEARDYVIHHFMPHPTGTQPIPDASDVPASIELRWDPIPGAKYYEVFLRDDWEGTEATASGLLTEPRFVPPQDAPAAGSMYGASTRDSNGNVLLGFQSWLQPEMCFRS
jgi:hypothetical protein